MVMQKKLLLSVQKNLASKSSLVSVNLCNIELTLDRNFVIKKYQYKLNLAL